MKNHSIKPLALIIMSLTIAGCGGGNDGGGGDSKPSTPSAPSDNVLLSDTTNAVAFFSDTTLASCNGLKKIVEDYTDGQLSGYRSEPVFSNIGQSVGCNIDNSYAMKDYLVLDGNFTNFKNESNSVEELCHVVGIPTNKSESSPVCILSGSDIGRRLNFDVSADGNLLSVTHEVSNMPHQAVISVFNGSDNSVKEIHKFSYHSIVDGSGIETWLNNLDHIVFEETFYNGEHNEPKLVSASLSGNVVIDPTVVNRPNGKMAWFEPARFGDKLLHNWRYNSDGTDVGMYNYVFDLSASNSEQLVTLNSPFGNDTNIFFIKYPMAISQDETAFFTSYFDAETRVNDGFVKIDHDSLHVSLIHDMSDIDNIIGDVNHNISSSNVVYVMSGKSTTTIEGVYGFDMVTLDPINSGDNLLSGELQDLIVNSYFSYPGGLKVVGTQYGDEKEYYYDQVNKEWVESVTDDSKVENLISIKR